LHLAKLARSVVLFKVRDDPSQGNRVILEMTSRANAESISILLIRGGYWDGADGDACGASFRSSR
jgi:hypothetical protein